MSDVLRTTFLIGLGAIGWFVTERSLLHTGDVPCPSMLAVAALVDRCFEGGREDCAKLDRTVPASCLMDRASEATEAKRHRRYVPDATEEVLLWR